MTIQEAVQRISPQWQQELVHLDLSCRIKQIVFSIIVGAGAGIVTAGIILAVHATSPTLFAIAISTTATGCIVAISAIGMVYRHDPAIAVRKQKAVIAPQFRDDFDQKSLDEILTTYGSEIFSDHAIVDDAVFTHLQPKLMRYLRQGEYENGDAAASLLQLPNIALDDKQLIYREYNKYLIAVGEAELECLEKQQDVLQESFRTLENQAIIYPGQERNLRTYEAPISEQANAACQVRIEQAKKAWLDWIRPRLGSVQK